MKKFGMTGRKHGFKARQQSMPAMSQRLTTQVTFESSCQSYLWVTDRGRSRLIKH